MMSIKTQIIPFTGVVTLNEQIQQLVAQESTSFIVVTGPAGTGKSAALQYLLDAMPQPENTMLPTCVRIFTFAKPSPQSLIRTIAETLEEKPAGNGEMGMIQYAATILQRNKVKLLIIDDADRLSDRCLKFLGKIQENWQRPIVLAGLPQLSSKFNKTFFSDMPASHKISFPPPTTEVIVEEFLPQYQLDNWHFDPANPFDYQLGQHLWQQARPSLRKLVNILRLASAMAALDDTRITQEIVDECLMLMGLQCYE